MPDWKRRARLLWPLAAGIAGAVWGYRLVTRKKTTSAHPEEPKAYMSLRELLMHFRSDDIARCLRKLSIPASGNKPERIDRLIHMAALPKREEGWSVSKSIEPFTEDELRRVCVALDIDAADKASMVTRLAARIDAVR